MTPLNSSHIKVVAASGQKMQHWHSLKLFASKQSSAKSRIRSFHLSWSSLPALKVLQFEYQRQLINTSAAWRLAFHRQRWITDEHLKAFIQQTICSERGKAASDAPITFTLPFASSSLEMNRLEVVVQSLCFYLTFICFHQCLWNLRCRQKQEEINCF